MNLNKLFLLIFLSFNTQIAFSEQWVEIGADAEAIYFVDLNLNFPSYRPFNLYLLLLYIIVLYNSNPKFNERS